MLNMDDTSQNQLLAALPTDECERLLTHLEPVQLRLGEILYESDRPLDYVYFTTTAIVSMFYVMEDGASAEIAAVGNDGMLGVSLIMGGETMPHRAMVLCAGTAYRLKPQALMDQFNRTGGRRGGAIKELFLRYTQAMMTQVSQTSVCNQHHSMEQKLCRWLLSNLDRCPSNELTLTQELIASMLGVRRESITEAAGKLQDYGYIHYRRGHITVLDRAGLEKKACECYQTVREEMDRLIPEVIAKQQAFIPCNERLSRSYITFKRTDLLFRHG